MLKAYLEEFGPDENVALNLFVSRGLGTNHKGSAHDMAAEYVMKDLGLGGVNLPVINIIEGTLLPDLQMPALYAGADCFVLPSRGEGWGMPYMEAMAMGLPTIGTNWSGNLEFMNKDNSYCIEIEGLTSVDDAQLADNPFYTGHNWAQPSCRHLRELMRHVYQNRNSAAEVGRKAKEDILNNWTIYHAADRVIKRVREISDKLGQRKAAPRKAITSEKADRTKDTSSPNNEHCALSHNSQGILA